MLTLICGSHEQAVLDKHGHQLLADFVHTTAYKHSGSLCQARPS